MRRAVLYLRRSTDMQEQSIGDQRTALQRYAEDHHLLIVKEFVDDAVSGTSTEGRDAFNAMIQTALNGTRSFEAILAWDIRRFSRGDVDEAGYFRHTLRQQGVEVIYVAENLTGDDVDDLIIGTKQWLARQESKDKSKVTIRGMISLIEKGRWGGGRAPYGYNRALYDSTGRLLHVLQDNEPSRQAPGDFVKLVPGDLEKVRTIQRLFDLFANRGLGYRAILTQFNRDGIRSPKGGRWGVGTLCAILRNPVYTGAMVWNKSSHGHFHSVTKQDNRVNIQSLGKRPAPRVIHNPQERWIVVEKSHEPLVSRELFAAANAKRHTRAQALHRYNGLGADSPYLLTSLLQCGHCQTRWHGHTKHRKGHTYLLYVCGGFSKYGRSVCPEQYVQKAALEDYVLKRIQERYLASGQWLSLLNLIKQEFEKLMQPNTDHRAHVEKRLKDIDRKVDLLLDAISPETAALINDKLHRLRDEKLQLERQQLALSQQSTVTVDVNTAAEETLAYLQRMDDVLTKASYREQKAFVRTFVGSYQIYPERAEAIVGFYKIPQHDRMKAALEPLALANVQSGVPALSLLPQLSLG